MNEWSDERTGVAAVAIIVGIGVFLTAMLLAILVYSMSWGYQFYL